MEAADGEEHLGDAEVKAPPNGVINELQDLGQDDNIQGQMEEFLGPHSEYNEEEEERKYYRRKRLGVIKNVVAASVGAMIVYSVYMGLLQMQLLLHYDMTYREVKYSNLGLEDIDHKMLMGINVTPIVGLLYTPLLIRFLGTKWMMFLASGIYALFVSTNYWERYYTLVPSAVAIGVVIVPLWASLGNYITRMAQQYYEYVNYKEEHVQEQKKLPKGACHRYIIIFQSVFHIIFFLSFIFAQFPMLVVFDQLTPGVPAKLHKNSHILFNVKVCGAPVSGVIPGLNTTILNGLPSSMLLIQVESVLMGFAFLSMIIFLALCGAAYRPTEEIDLRSIGWGNIFQLPFKHLRDYRLRLLCPFFVYSGFETLFAIKGFSLSYGVCILGLDKLWLLIGAYGFSCSLFSSLSLLLLRFPRWICVVGGAVVHLILLVALQIFSLVRKSDETYSEYLVPLLVISMLWGLGTALNKTGLSTLLGVLYAEEKERLDFVYTIYHWWQAIAIFIVYLWSQLPMRAKLSILMVFLILSCYCYWVMERRVAKDVRPRLPRIPRPRHKVKGYRYLEDDNSDESDSEKSQEEEEEEEEEGENEEQVVEEDREERGQDQWVDSPGARRRRAGGQHQGEDSSGGEGERGEEGW